ncbi:hypothetical protein Pcinc_021983 [Petrolisthes cinctipes]|uniref:Uncharacterized protein n=1 Tax=Petrolisthes cinctipes TaxID=88211 RepID=A0AAE1FGD5_PETCI|nr:hypothetical protein Pcinc_021983 [Petrolisthes cinctipes]
MITLESSMGLAERDHGYDDGGYGGGYGGGHGGGYGGGYDGNVQNFRGSCQWVSWGWLAGWVGVVGLAGWVGGCRWAGWLGGWVSLGWLAGWVGVVGLAGWVGECRRAGWLGGWVSWGWVAGYYLDPFILLTLVALALLTALLTWWCTNNDCFTGGPTICMCIGDYCCNDIFRDTRRTLPSSVTEGITMMLTTTSPLKPPWTRTEFITRGTTHTLNPWSNFSMIYRYP